MARPDRRGEHRRSGVELAVVQVELHPHSVGIAYTDDRPWFSSMIGSGSNPAERNRATTTSRGSSASNASSQAPGRRRGGARASPMSQATPPTYPDATWNRPRGPALDRTVWRRRHRSSNESARLSCLAPGLRMEPPQVLFQRRLDERRQRLARVDRRVLHPSNQVARQIDVELLLSGGHASILAH